MNLLKVGLERTNRSSGMIDQNVSNTKVFDLLLSNSVMSGRSHELGSQFDNYKVH